LPRSNKDCNWPYDSNERPNQDLNGMINKIPEFRVQLNETKFSTKFGPPKLKTYKC
jgi:hypothetical protein